MKPVLYLPSSGGVFTRPLILSILCSVLVFMLPSEARDLFWPVAAAVFGISMLIIPFYFVMLGIRGVYLPRKVIIDLNNRQLTVKKRLFLSRTTYFTSFGELQAVVFERTARDVHHREYIHKYAEFACNVRSRGEENVTVYKHSSYKVVRELVVELSRWLNLSIVDRISPMNPEKRYQTVIEFNRPFLMREIAETGVNNPSFDGTSLKQLMNSQEPLKRVRIEEDVETVTIRDYQSGDERYRMQIYAFMGLFACIVVVWPVITANLLETLLYFLAFLAVTLLLRVPVGPVGLLRFNEKIVFTSLGMVININRFIPYEKILDVRLTTTIERVLTIEIVTEKKIFTVGKFFYDTVYPGKTRQSAIANCLIRGSVMHALIIKYMREMSDLNGAVK